MLILDGVYANGAVLGGGSTVTVAFAEEVVRAASIGSESPAGSQAPAPSPVTRSRSVPDPVTANE